MERQSSGRCWLLIATTVIVSLGLTAAQERSRINSSLSTPPDSHHVNKQRKGSCFGKAIFARCSCIHVEYDMRLCTAWKLLNTTSSVRPEIKVFTNFIKGLAGRSQAPAVTGRCADYTDTINKLYRSGSLNYSTDEEAKIYGIDWNFCNDMFEKNNMGCNYTLVQATSVHNSSAEKIYSYVRSFTNASHHIQLGKTYQLDMEKCQEFVTTSVTGDGSLPTSSSASTESSPFFPINTRERREPMMAVTISTTRENGDGKQAHSAGIVLFGSYILAHWCFYFCVIVYINSFP